MNQRLDSLDALRGFDLIMLVVFEHFVFQLQPAIDAGWYDSFLKCFTHKEWTGFSPWDLVMPLFMFMSGVTIPYSLKEYRESGQYGSFYRRLLRRVTLLWLLGMACQGNLLGLDPQHIYLFSNTLQAIAVGYCFAALLFLHTRLRTQLCVVAGLLLAFWGTMEMVSVGDFGGGSYTPQGNLAEGIDRFVLGRFRDKAEMVGGVVVFREGYTYTWILSSLNFVATVMSGVFAGELLSSPLTAKKKQMVLLMAGLGMAACGWAWGTVHPVIKHIWTSSMVLVSSGYCFLLLWAFYSWIDCRGHKRHLTILKVYGMNSITAYTVSMVVDFSSISQSLLHGTEQYVGAYYPALIALANAFIVFCMLYAMYRHKLFLRV